jgi:hypothetical protein
MRVFIFAMLMYGSAMRDKGSRVVGIVMGLLALASTFVIPFGIRNEIAKWLTVPRWFFSLLLALTALCLIAATLVPILSLVASLKPQFITYTCDTVGLQDLDACYRLFQETIPVELPTIEKVREWHKKCPGAFRQIWRERRGLRISRDLVGCFHVAPVTMDAVAKLESNALLGSHFVPDHIASSFNSAAGLYIGAIAATSMRARHHTLLMLLGFVSSHSRTTPLPVYARLLPPDGKRLGEKYGFVPVVGTASDQTQLIYKRLI